MRTTFGIGFLALLAAGGAMAQQDRDWDAVTLTIHHVADNVYYLEGTGGNIGLSVGEDGIVMIDDQFAPLTDRILATIADLDDGEIRFVINTHVHGDHIGGNENLGRLGITILANDRVRVINTHVHGDHIGGNENLGRLGITILANDRVRVRMVDEMAAGLALPVLTYSDTTTVYLNDDEVHVFTVPPAHTDGDSFIHFRSTDVLHLGDVFRTNNFPYIDVSRGGTLKGTLEALGIAIGMSGPDTLIIPGHGGLSTREDVVEFRDMALAIAERVERLVRDGASFEDVLAAGTTAEYEERWGDPERFLTGLYTEVGGEL